MYVSIVFFYRIRQFFSAQFTNRPKEIEMPSLKLYNFNFKTTLRTSAEKMVTPNVEMSNAVSLYPRRNNPRFDLLRMNSGSAVIEKECRKLSKKTGRVKIDAI
jgi:hypothetical protein